MFKRGIVYRGVYCPSLSNSFREVHLELAYQRYSHRQRQKSLIIVNLVDALLKIVLAAVREQYNFDLDNDGAARSQNCKCNDQ